MRTLALSASLVLLGAPAALAQNARTEQPLASARQVAVATGGEVQATLLLDDAQNLSVATSDDCGVTWNDPVSVDDDASGAARSLTPTSLQVVGTYVFAAWLDARDGANSVWFNYSFDAGASWEGARRIDDGSVAGSGDVRGFRFAATPGPLVPNAYVLVRLAPEPGQLEELRLVANDGTTVDAFQAAVDVPALAAQTANVSAIDLLARGDDLYVVWQDDREGLEEVWFQRSEDRGTTWAASDLQITAAGDQDGDSDAPVQIAGDGQTFAIVWEEREPTSAPAEIRAALSTDGALTFGAEQRVGTYAASVDANTAEVIVHDNGNVSVLWQDDRSGMSSIYAATAVGGTFGSDALLSPSGGTRVRASAAGGTGVACWVSGADKAQTAYTLDGGLNWTTLLLSQDNALPVTSTACALDPFSGRFGSSPNLVAAWTRDNAGTSEGVVGGYSPCGPATLVERTAGNNVSSLTGSLPILGDPLDLSVDLDTTGHPMALVVAFEAALDLPVQGGYVLLVDVTNPRGELLQLPAAAGPQADFSVDLPNDPCLCGYVYFSQALHFGGGMPFALSNALDGELGAF